MPTTNPDRLARLLEAARNMRQVQKTYFSTRTREDLTISKECERRFDELLEEDDRRTRQGSLF